MERQALEVTPREAGRKGAARRLRAGGHVPAVLYGGKIEPVTLSVEGRLLDEVLQTGANAILDLKGPPAVKGKLALVKAVQRDPVSRRVLHCDFYAVDVNQTVTVSVALHHEGKAKGVEMGGVLEPILRDLEVECLPLEIPSAISVDVSALDIGDSIHVRDVPVPDTVRILNDPDATVIHVIAPRVEEEPVAVEEEVAAAAEAPEGAEAPTPEAGGERDEGSGDSGKE
jgi:large subunit ribosomal protein L25